MQLKQSRVLADVAIVLSMALVGIQCSLGLDKPYEGGAPMEGEGQGIVTPAGEGETSPPAEGESEAEPRAEGEAESEPAPEGEAESARDGEDLGEGEGNPDCLLGGVNMDGIVDSTDVGILRNLLVSIEAHNT